MAIRLLTTHWRALIEGRTGVLTQRALGPLLTAMAWPYDGGHRLRLQAHARGWAPVNRLPCRVISVGNLTLGGTGKTPLVEAIAALLQRHGHRVGVLSRGYGRQGAEPLVVVADGQRCLASAAAAGDEPIMLAEHMPGVPVVVGRDRYAAGRLAVQRFSLDTVVVDDGFQHVQLARDLDILTLDATRPFGSGRLFPRGDLRERRSAMGRADAIVLTHWAPGVLLPDGIPSPPATQLFYSRHTPQTVRVLADGHDLSLSSVVGERLLAFCGIGSPESFQRTLDEIGARVVGFWSFPDHHVYTRSDLEGLARMAKARGARALITTEKDAVRLRHLQPLPYEVWELCIQATIVDPQGGWDACILGMARPQGDSSEAQPWGWPYGRD